MASQSLAALLADVGSKVEPRHNGETETASQTPGDSVPEDERALCPVSTDVSLDSSPPMDTVTSLSPHDAPSSDAHSTAHIPVVHAAHIPLEEVQKGETAMEGMDMVENSQKPPSPDNAIPISMPSTAAVITDTIEPDITLSTAAIAVEPTEAANASETIMTLSTEGVTTDCTDGATVPSTEAVTVGSSTIDSSAATLMPSTEVAVVGSSTIDSSAATLMLSTEAVVVDSDKIADSVAVATADSTVVAASDSTAPLIADPAAPIITHSATIETASTNPPHSTQVPSTASSKPGINAPTEELNRTTAKHEEEFQSETESIQIPAHWHPKPCVHISSIGGPLTEEDLLPLFNKYGPIASVSFENERHDAVLIRYELHLENGEELLAQVREATNSTKLGDKTLIVEPFRPDSLLFVGNLTPGIDDAALQAMFEPHGKIERAFVLRNAEGQSKCYGFVEYSLKAQAMTAKAVMGNINMDGRVLRVEWSDCKRVEDMFSTVLFVDRIPREGLQIEGALKSLFGKYGKIRDSHLAIGTGNQIRGFAFIDFYHSSTADKAHQALDGYNFEGSSIRVSFANPSKSAQSYKFRYGAQAGQGSSGRGGAAGGSGVLSGPPSRGLSSRGPSSRVPTPMPLLPSRFMSPARPGMLGFGIGMQFGRGSFDRGTFHGSGRGMLGPAGRLLGSMTPRPGSAVVENSLQKLPFGQGAVSITPSAIVQVATAQARAREEEAKARAEAAKHGGSRSFSVSVGDSMSMNHYQKLQQLQHQSYLQQQQASAYDQQYKQADLYSHQHASISHHQASLHPQQQAWNQLQQQHSHQNLQLQRMPYHTGSSQSFLQQHHADQSTQNDNYYQQASQQAQQHGYTSQYGQHQGYQYGPQAAHLYGQQVAQQTAEQYQQSTQQPQAAAYPQQNYGEQYALQQQASQQAYNASATFEASAGLDAAQQQAYSAYYQQQAQAQAQAVTNPEAGQGTATSTTPATTQQSYEAQWAAYYASQAAYQQQAASTDVGQKRSADQMEQNQAAYNYAAYSQQGGAGYQQQQQAQQVSNESATYSAAAYQQQAAFAAAAYQQQGAAGYQQAAATASYPVSGQMGYEQSSSVSADGAYQQPAAAFQGQTAVYDYSKRPRF